MNVGETPAVVGQPEKWADRIRLFSTDSPEPQELGPEDAGPLPDAYGVTDLEKTETEVQAINEVVAGLNELRRVLFGDAPLAFSAERVHLVTPEEFQAKIAPSRRFKGKAMYGHVYLWRGWPVADLQALLAHELTHAVSYLWLDVHQEGADAGDGIKWPPITMRRNGLVLIDPSFGTWLPHFHGLNEGVTETTAMMIRRIVAAKSLLLDEGGRKHLSSWTSSPPLVKFMDTLVATAAGPDGDSVATWKLLIRDLLTGTDEFLPLLETKLFGSTHILRCTGATPLELLAAVKKLGFEDTAAFISKFRRR